MTVDLLIRQAQLGATADRPLMDLAIDGGTIVALAPHLDLDGEELPAHGRLLLPGLVETHLHLDKAHLAGPDIGAAGLRGAIVATTEAKASFTPDDVYSRASKTLRACVAHGTTFVRTHVELDPVVELRGLEGVIAAAKDLADAITVEVCVFPQDGLSDQPDTKRLLIEGLGHGATVIGGAPYTDADPRAQIDAIFELAQQFDVDIDLHLDLSEALDSMQIDYVCRRTDQTQWGGRVTVGHVTQLSLLAPDELQRIARRIASAGVSVTTLPSTDLFLMGRQATEAKPRGVAPVETLRAHRVRCSISTNNVMNSFTPYGDGSLVRMANLYANVAHISDAARLADCLSMITDQAAAIVGLTGYGFDEGSPADMVLLDAKSAAQAVAEIAPAVWGIKHGRRTFTRPDVVLHNCSSRGRQATP